HVDAAFHTVNGVGSHDQIDFGAQSHGPFTRCLRFAAFLPASRSSGHARLASGWGSTFAGRAFQLARSLVKFRLSLHSLPPHPGFAWRTDSSTVLGTSKPYHRHRPEETVLHQVLSAHWQEFVERADAGGGLPRFVVKEVDEY